MSSWTTIRALALERDRHRCKFCYNSYPHMEVHHLFPRNLGGTDSLDNAATMCAKCHDMIHTLKLIRLPLHAEISIAKAYA